MTDILRLLLFLMVGSTCIAGSNRSANKAVILELRAMKDADQAARLSKNPDLGLIAKADEARLQRVLTLLANGQIKDAESQECAAWILQHSPDIFCNGVPRAVSRDNYLLAHLLAKSAAEKGRKSARWISAASLDRYLVASGKPQKFGTQTVFDPKTNKMTVPPIDPETTDAERIKWDVEPLNEFLQRLQEESH